MSGDGAYYYRGLTTHHVYVFSSPLVIDGAGGAGEDGGTYNGERVILVNRDGSVRRGTAGPSPDGYSPGAAPSLWESL